jgi:hypothetical protein
MELTLKVKNILALFATADVIHVHGFSDFDQYEYHDDVDLTANEPLITLPGDDGFAIEFSYMALDFAAIGGTTYLNIRDTDGITRSVSFYMRAAMNVDKINEEKE